MERTVVDWVEELRGLSPVQAAEAILSELGKQRASVTSEQLPMHLQPGPCSPKKRKSACNECGPGHLGLGGWV